MKNLKLMALGIGICGTVFNLLGEPEPCWLCGNYRHQEPGKFCNVEAVEMFLNETEDGLKRAENFLSSANVVKTEEEDDDHITIGLEAPQNALTEEVLIWYLTHWNDKNIHINMPYNPQLALLLSKVLAKGCLIERIRFNSIPLWIQIFLSISIPQRDDDMPEEFFRALNASNITVNFDKELKKSEVNMIGEMLGEEESRLSRFEIDVSKLGFYNWENFGKSLRKNYYLRELYVRQWNSAQKGVAGLVLGTHLSKVTIDYEDRRTNILAEIHEAFDPENGMDLPPHFNLRPNSYRADVPCLADLMARSKTLENIFGILIEGDKQTKMIAGAILKNFVNDGALYCCRFHFASVGSEGMEALGLAVFLNVQMAELGPGESYIFQTLLPETSKEAAIVRAKELELITSEEAETLKQKHNIKPEENHRVIEDSVTDGD